MTDEKIEVTDVQEGNSVDNKSTTDSGGVEDKSTTPKTSVDVDTIKAEYDKQIATYGDDLNKLKSALNKRENLLTKEWENERSTLLGQIDKFAVQGMDEDQKSEYEKSRANEQYKALQDKNLEYAAEVDSLKLTMDAIEFFDAKGISPSNLNRSEGYEALVRSGYAGIDSQIDNLKAELAKAKLQTTKVEKSDPEPAPDVVTDTGAPASGNPSWEDLRKKYGGDDEEIYRLVEQLALPATTIPE